MSGTYTARWKARRKKWAAAFWRRWLRKQARELKAELARLEASWRREAERRELVRGIGDRKGWRLSAVGTLGAWCAPIAGRS